MNKKIQSSIQAIPFLILSCILFILGIYLPQMRGKSVTLEVLGIGAGILLGIVVTLFGKMQWLGKVQNQSKNIKVMSSNREKSINVGDVSWRFLISIILLLILAGEFLIAFFKPVIANLGSLLLGLSIGLSLVFSLARLHYVVFRKNP